MFHLLLSWRIREIAMVKSMNATGEISQLMGDKVYRIFGLCSQVKNLNGMNSPAQSCLIRSISQKREVTVQRFLPLKICSILCKPLDNSNLCSYIKSECNTSILCKPLNITLNFFSYIRPKCNFQLPARKYCSALFITSDKLSQLCSNVTPSYDIANVLVNQEDILNNLKQRQLDVSQYDFVKIKDSHEKYVSVEKTLTELGYKIIELEDYLQKNKSQMEESQIELKYQERRDLRAEMRKFDDFLLEFQKNVVIKILKLPNRLDSNTPPDVYETIYEFDPETVKSQEHSIDILEKLRKYVKFASKLNINYLGDAAKFEYLFPIFLKQYFITKHSFIPFTNTDLCKGVIVEGTGTPYLCPYDNIVLLNNELELGDIGYDERRYHLVGSAHMSMFCAYHTNHSVSVKDLPVKYISSGKRYGFQSIVQDLEKIPKVKDGVSIEDLYNSIQKENVSIFIGTKDREDLLKEIDKLDFFFKSFFCALNLKHRICRTPAPHLHPSESARLEYQLFSDSLNSWVTCADICVNEDYISRRLSMCQHISVTSYEKKFLHVLNTNVYVNALLLNLIENDETLDVDHFRKVFDSI